MLTDRDNRYCIECVFYKDDDLLNVRHYLQCEVFADVHEEEQRPSLPISLVKAIQASHHVKMSFEKWRHDIPVHAGSMMLPASGVYSVKMGKPEECSIIYAKGNKHGPSWVSVVFEAADGKVTSTKMQPACFETVLYLKNIDELQPSPD